MSKTIDEKVVSMQFDNKNFESNVQHSLSTLDKLKNSLKLDGASKGLDNLKTAANSLDFSRSEFAATQAGFHISDVFEKVTRFLENDIARRIVNVGSKIVKEFTIEPISTGFSEFELKMGSVQTIMASTGADLQTVNQYLAELNEYSDKTIYSFSDMTNNIGKFTNAGVKLEDAVAAIKGISNEAALSGANANEASRAMYNFSQALSAGYVKLIDWKSIENANMATVGFKEELIKTAVEVGTLTKTSDGLYNTGKRNISATKEFNDSLQDQWMTTDVLTKTLAKYADENTDIGKKAYAAAQDVKTFSMMMDTLKEAAQSGWAETWEIIIGDFEQGKQLWTGLSTVLGDLIAVTSDARNDLLRGVFGKNVSTFLGDMTGMSEKSFESLKKLGEETNYTGQKYYMLSNTLAEGDSKMRNMITEMLKFENSGKGVNAYLAEMTGKSEESIEALRKLGKETNYTGQEFNTLAFSMAHGNAKTKNLIVNIIKYADELSGREMIIQSFANIWKGICEVLNVVKDAFHDVFPPVELEDRVDALKNLITKFYEFTQKLHLGEEKAKKLREAFKGLFSILDIFKKVVVAVGKGFSSIFKTDGIGGFTDMLLNASAAVGNFFTSLNDGFDGSKLSDIFVKIGTAVGNFISFVGGKLEAFTQYLPAIGEGIKTVVGKIWNGIKEVVSFLTDNFTFMDLFAGLTGGGIFIAGKKFADLMGTIKESIEGLFGKKSKGILGSIKEVLGSLHDSLEAFTTGIKVASIVAIAVAVGILTSSVRKLSELSPGEITKALSAIGTMMFMLNQSLKSITKTLGKNGSKGIISTGIGLVLFAASIKILAGALEKIGSLSLKQLIKGLIGMGGAMFGLCLSLKALNKVKIPLSTSVAMLALAESCKIMADALVKFGSMSWDEIGRGLTAMGGALTEMTAVMSILQKFGGFKSLLSSIGIYIIVQSLSEMADGLKKFAEMTWDEIGRGLTAMGGALTELSAALVIVGDVAGFSSIFAAGALLIVTQGLDDIANALIQFGSMTWDEIKRGLTAMGGALTELTVALTVVSKVAGFSSLFGAGALVIVIEGLDELSDALIKFGSMTWDEIKQGLVAMGGALGEVATACGVLGKIAGFSGIFGAGAILIVIQGLDDLAKALYKFGSMSWPEIGRGLSAMGGALLEVSLFSGALGMIAGFSGILGAGAILITIQGLGDLADALIKFGSMSWEEIGHGLTAMGLALGEVALFSGALGSIAGLSGIIGGEAIKITTQGLGDLADALIKFGSMSWDEIGRGLTAMGSALAEIAIGGLANTLSVLGAAAIAEVAKPLGDLADSVMKWNGVSVPEGLGTQLGTLADGIFSFTLDGLGASAIAEVATPLGNLADSIKKWADVTVPDGLQTKLEGIANGVKAFSWVFMGGWSLSTLVDPLGKLADSINKWKDVTVPDDLETKLTGIANGIKGFSWAFTAGWSLSTLVDPLSKLPDAIKKWKDVSLPEKLPEDLEKLADCIKSFSWTFLGSWSLDSVTGPLGAMADAIKKWNGLTIPEGVTEKLKDFADSVIDFGKQIKDLEGIDTGKISTLASAVNSLNTSIQGITAVDMTKINTFVTSIRQLGGLKIDTSALAKTSSEISSAVTKMMDAVNKIVSSSKTKFSESMRTSMDGMTAAINSRQASIISAINNILNGLIKAISSKKSAVESAFKSLVSGAADAISSYKSSIEKAGRDLGDGLTIGIKDKEKEVYDAGVKLGQKAVQGEKDGQQSHSPSKLTIQAGKWLGEGLVIGMDKMGSAVYKSGKSMGKKAVDSLSGAISTISDVVSGDSSITPTIRPVVDMSNLNTTEIKLGANVDTYLTRPINSLSSVISDAQREFNASNTEIRNAINDLRKDVDSFYSMVDGKDTSLYVDSKMLASTIARPMNRELNILSKRGVY